MAAARRAPTAPASSRSTAGSILAFAGGARPQHQRDLALGRLREALGQLRGGAPRRPARAAWSARGRRPRRGRGRARPALPGWPAAGGATRTRRSAGRSRRAARAPRPAAAAARQEAGEHEAAARQARRPPAPSSPPTGQAAPSTERPRSIIAATAARRDRTGRRAGVAQQADPLAARRSGRRSAGIWAASLCSCRDSSGRSMPWRSSSVRERRVSSQAATSARRSSSSSAQRDVPQVADRGRADDQLTGLDGHRPTVLLQAAGDRSPDRGRARPRPACRRRCPAGEATRTRAAGRLQHAAPVLLPGPAPSSSSPAALMPPPITTSSG